MLEKFVDELPIIDEILPIRSYHQAPFYEVTMRETYQKLHRDLPPTKVWGYNGQYPGPTFHVQRNQTVHVLWKNELPKKHFLPIDTTVHGAGNDVPEVRTVVHLHGGITPDTSDGYPEAWFTNGFQEVGPYFTHQLYTYPNRQQGTTLWYHDHAVGITRLNIYAGLAGMYIIHDPAETYLNLPKAPYDLPLLIQDRSFNPDGSLYYPSQPNPPVPNVNPSVVPEFLGDTVLVNGKVWPFMNVEPRRYRFRILNGSNARIYRLSLSNGLSFIQIGTDQGLLEQPILVPELLLAPAERADVIIDFSNGFQQSIVMENNPEPPFPPGDPNPEGPVMEFRVNKPLTCPDTSSIPAHLAAIPKLLTYQKNRNLLLNMRPDPYGREIHLLDNRVWADSVSEIPSLGNTEIWTLINISNATHPIHLHLVQFQIVDRQPFDADIYKKDGRIVPTGPRTLPDLNERGWKDTVRANPHEITRIIMTFGPYPGLFVWHCHILEHEDYEMMRPYYIVGHGDRYIVPL
ncbi:spore coat protein A [Pontibacillus salipaludis]|uniref:Spore coat protein A n=2 Tax=Pontibacillus salipaludis TaxID=1697394 RepID=A0ABQ1QE00_9BACI|nr:spore coat protein A [Pontibacillus salipaludis]